MKLAFLILSLCLSLQFYGQEDYTININDSIFKISLDKNYDLNIGGGKIKFSISANDTLNYNDDLISFKYTKNFNLNRTKVETGIEQILLMTADGSGVLIQRYTTLNPTTLNELMLREVTKESISYGYVLKREDYNLKTVNGQSIKIDKAVLKYKDETNVYEITTLGRKDEGVLIMTIKMDDDKKSEGEKLINLLWKSLILK